MKKLIVFTLGLYLLGATIEQACAATGFKFYTSTVTISGAILSGATASTTDFPLANLISSTDNTGHTYNFPIGLIGEAVSDTTNNATGIGGVASSNAAGEGRGVSGVGKVTATSDSADSIGVYGSALDTHASGRNIGVQGRASDGLTNYAFYSVAGDNYFNGSETITGNLTASSETITHTLTADSFSGSGAALTAITAANISGGSLGSNVIASSVAVGSVYNSATTATSANTPSAIVSRDPSGNFTAGTITGSLVGAASLNVLKAGGTMTGDLTVPGLNVTTVTFPGGGYFNTVKNILNNNLTVTSSVTFSANAFSVGGSTVIVSNGGLGLGAVTPVSGNITLAHAKKLAWLADGTALDGRSWVYAYDSADINITHANAGNINLTADVGKNVAVVSNAFSVGGSTLVVNQGLVGIGGAPVEALTILRSNAGTNKTCIQLRNESASQNGKICQDNSGSNNLDLSSNLVDANNSVTITVAGSERMRIKGSGNVGIGTTAPATKLHLSSGTITVDGNVTPSLITSAGVKIGTTSIAAGFFHVQTPAGTDSRTAYALKISSGDGTSTFGIHPNGHLSIYGALSAVANCTNGAIVANSHDVAGAVAFTGANSTCDVTFGSAYDSAPVCVISGSSAGAGEGVTISAVSTTGFTFTPIAGAWDNLDRVNYICMGIH